MSEDPNLDPNSPILAVVFDLDGPRFDAEKLLFRVASAMIGWPTDRDALIARLETPRRIDADGMLDPEAPFPESVRGRRTAGVAHGVG